MFASDTEIGGGDTRLSSDIILDFAHGDLIDLSQIDARETAFDFANDAFAFIGWAAFTGVAGQLHAVSSFATAVPLIEGDLNGDRIADFQLAVSGLRSFTASDFIL